MINVAVNISSKIIVLATFNAIVVNAANGTVENSDQTYSDVVAPGATLILPEVNHIDSDGLVVVKPAVTPFVSTLCPVKAGIAYKVPQKPNTATSYQLYDCDWELANGTYDYTPPPYPLNYAELDLLTDPTGATLLNNNAFGNKRRFTNALGVESLYADNYVVDNLTRLGIYSKITAKEIWATTLATIHNQTVEGYSDWRVANILEVYSFLDMDGGNPIGKNTSTYFKSFNQTNYWTNQTRFNNQTVAVMRAEITTGRMVYDILSSGASRYTIAVRNHF